jgi:hypothetical protein
MVWGGYKGGPGGSGGIWQPTNSGVKDFPIGGDLGWKPQEWKNALGSGIDPNENTFEYPGSDNSTLTIQPQYYLASDNGGYSDDFGSVTTPTVEEADYSDINKPTDAHSATANEGLPPGFERLNLEELLAQGNEMLDKEWAGREALINRYAANNMRRSAGLAGKMGSYGSGMLAANRQTLLNTMGEIDRQKSAFEDQRREMFYKWMDTKVGRDIADTSFYRGEASREADWRRGIDTNLWGAQLDARKAAADLRNQYGAARFSAGLADVAKQRDAARNWSEEDHRFGNRIKEIAYEAGLNNPPEPVVDGEGRAVSIGKLDEAIQFAENYGTPEDVATAKKQKADWLKLHPSEEEQWAKMSPEKKANMESALNAVGLTREPDGKIRALPKTGEKAAQKNQKSAEESTRDFYGKL